jgi:ATP-dependent 26S proteasome regulatory subunit
MVLQGQVLLYVACSHMMLKGKTMIGKAVATETGAFHFLINGPEITCEDSSSAVLLLC